MCNRENAVMGKEIDYMKIMEYQLVKQNDFNTLRVVKEHDYDGECRTDEGTVRMLNSLFYLNKVDYEYLYAIARDEVGKILGVCQLGHGSEERCNFNMKELFAFLFLIRADGFELAHNHPFELSWEPSFTDIRTTKNLLKYENDFDIRFLEDYVVCVDKYSKTLEAIKSNEVRFYDLDDETEEVFNVTEQSMQILMAFIESNDEIYERLKYDEQIEISLCGAVAYITEDEKRKLAMFI